VSVLKCNVNELRTFGYRLTVCLLMEGMGFKGQDVHYTILVVDH